MYAVRFQLGRPKPEYGAQITRPPLTLITGLRSFHGASEFHAFFNSHQFPDRHSHIICFTRKTRGAPSFASD